MAAQWPLIEFVITYSGRYLRAVSLVLLMGVSVAQAQPAGVVQELQMPAWIDRGEISTALSPGMRIHNNDHIRTGPGSRVLFQLEEGSFVRLGEDSEVVFRDISRVNASNSVFSGLLDVIKGSLRYTTTLLSQQYRRNLLLRFSALTAEVNHADVWGATTADRDILSLINGDIRVRQTGQDEFHMQQPYSVYIAPKSGPAEAVAPVEPEQMKRWMAQVELKHEDGALTGNGLWALILKSLQERSQAVQELSELHTGGYPAVLHTVSIKGQRWHRIMIRGFARENGARKTARDLEGKYGIHDAWPSHY